MAFCINDINVVFYHGNCLDGFGSAFIVWDYYKSKYGLDRANEIKYIPCYFDNPIVDFKSIVSNKNVLLLDFSFEYDILVDIIKDSNSFLIIDHHKTAFDQLVNIDPLYKIFNMKKSTVGLTWDYFYFQDNSKSLPNFLAMIQDYDLWTYLIPTTADFICYMNYVDLDKKYNFNYWIQLLDQEHLNLCINHGKEYVQCQNSLVKTISDKTSFIVHNINGTYLVAMYCNSSVLKSEIGSKMMTDYWIGDFACCWDYRQQNNKTRYSFRSTDNKTDVSVIALANGGGGNRNASAARLDGCVSVLPYPIINDHGLIQLLNNVKIIDIVFDKKCERCAVIEADSFNDQWVSTSFIELLKRKFSQDNQCIFIMFKCKTPEIDYDFTTGQVIPIYDYVLIYNENILDDLVSILSIKACVDKQLYNMFQSSKSIEEIFNLIGKTPEITDESDPFISSQSTDSDSDSNSDLDENTDCLHIESDENISTNTKSIVSFDNEGINIQKNKYNHMIPKVASATDKSAFMQIYDINAQKFDYNESDDDDTDIISDDELNKSFD